MTLSKAQRAAIREMFGGHCAYCGIVLPEKWHADHVKAVYREWWKKHLPEFTHKVQDGNIMQVKSDRTIRMMRPENDTIDNFFPACRPCNIDKSVLDIEDWRKKLERGPQVLRNNYATYRHSERFGIVAVVQTSVVFYFERCKSAPFLQGAEEQETGK